MTGPASTIDPRDAAVDAAAAEMIRFVSDWAVRYALSDLEYVYVLHRLVSVRLQIMGARERDGTGPTHSPPRFDGGR